MLSRAARCWRCGEPAGRGGIDTRIPIVLAQGRAAMIPIPDSRRQTDAPADHLTPASFRLLGNRPIPLPSAADTEGAAGFNPRQIINALKYHWFLFLVLGSLLAGGLGTAAWELLPAKYTTYSVLRVAA